MLTKHWNATHQASVTVFSHRRSVLVSLKCHAENIYLLLRASAVGSEHALYPHIWILLIAPPRLNLAFYTHYELP